jgi:hypothetical protein
MRRLVVIAVLSAGLVGCGQTSSPHLQSADASRLISLTRQIAGENACGQSRDIPKLRTQAIALVNQHRVPAALQEPLLSGVQALAAQTPVCLPSVPIAKTPPPAPAHKKPHGHGHGHDPGHGHDHGDKGH